MTPLLLLLAAQAVSQVDSRDLPYPQSLSAASGAYKATFTTRKADISDSDALAWWGTDHGAKGALEISKLTIYRKNQPITVPVSAYTGLLWPWKLAVVPTRGGCRVRIVGSDAAGAYTCVLYIKGDKVVERTVHGGEFPENNEITYYHYLNPKDVD